MLSSTSHETATYDCSFGQIIFYRFQLINCKLIGFYTGSGLKIVLRNSTDFSNNRYPTKQFSQISIRKSPKESSLSQRVCLFCIRIPCNLGEFCSIQSQICPVNHVIPGRINLIKCIVVGINSPVITESASSPDNGNIVHIGAFTSEIKYPLLFCRIDP